MAVTDAPALTVASVRNHRPQKKRREIPDAKNGLRLLIHPTGRKTWIMRFRQPSGRAAKLTLGSVDETGQELHGHPAIGGHLTLAAARVLASEIRRQRALHRDPVADHRAEKLLRLRVASGQDTSTFSAAARFYVEHGRRKRVSQKVLRNRGWRATAALLGLRYAGDGDEPTLISGGLAERWRDKKVSDVTIDDVFVVVDEARTHGIPGRQRRNAEPSEVRAREMLTALSGMFRFLVGKRRAPSNPCLGIQRPAGVPSRDRVLEAIKNGGAEVRWLWLACEKIDYPLGPLVQLLLLTGQRRSEVAEMPWSELSDDLSTWSIPGERTKNGRRHDVPLAPLARDILRSVLRVGPHVFTTNRRTPVSGFSKMKARLDKLMLDVAREDKPEAIVAPWRIHDLRRTAVTGMADIGVAPHVVEAAVNHISGHRAGVAGTYNRSQLAKPMRTALERWAQHIERVAGDRAAGKVVPMRRPK